MSKVTSPQEGTAFTPYVTRETAEKQETQRRREVERWGSQIKKRKKKVVRAGKEG